jgi:hypothetical protein
MEMISIVGVFVTFIVDIGGFSLDTPGATFASVLCSTGKSTNTIISDVALVTSSTGDRVSNSVIRRASWIIEF